MADLTYLNHPLPLIFSSHLISSTFQFLEFHNIQNISSPRILLWFITAIIAIQNVSPHFSSTYTNTKYHQTMGEEMVCTYKTHRAQQKSNWHFAFSLPLYSTCTFKLLFVLLSIYCCATNVPAFHGRSSLDQSRKVKQLNHKCFRLHTKQPSSPATATSNCFIYIKSFHIWSVGHSPSHTKGW